VRLVVRVLAPEELSAEELAEELVSGGWTALTEARECPECSGTGRAQTR
jgi:hypothetical protein